MPYGLCFSATLAYLRLGGVDAGEVVVQATFARPELCQHAGVFLTEPIVQCSCVFTGYGLVNVSSKGVFLRRCHFSFREVVCVFAPRRRR
jgi:Na+-translocating ferredoxin:NAD+ oxidoreductase RnfA subunit